MTSNTTTEAYVQDLEFRGFIRGVTIKNKATGKSLCRYFGGIPYAEPPFGARRWRLPQELASCYRYGTRAEPADFTGQVGICPQISAPQKVWDEDCLQCNIWIPVGEKPADGWPVYFYIRE